MNFVSIKICYELIGQCTYHMHSVPINYSSIPVKVSVYVDTWQTGKLNHNLVMRVFQCCGGDRFS